MVLSVFLKASRTTVRACCLGLFGAVVSSAAHADTAQVPVTTADLGEIAFYPIRTAPATVVTLNDTDVSAEISGLLIDLAVKVGETVEKGDVVAQIDCRDAETELAQANAAYNAGKANNAYDQSQLAKAKRLSKSKSISSEERDRRKKNALVSAAELDKSKAQLNKARRAVDRCDIKAPFNAVVVERLASVGDFVTRGTAIAQLLDTDSTEVSARVQEKDLDTVQVAKEAFFDSQNESYPVGLRTVVPVMESRLRSYETRFTFAENKAAPGSAGRLRWLAPVPHIPAELIVRREALGVFVVDEGHARFVKIEQAQEGKPAPWTRTLEGRVIVDGRFSISDGDPVQVKSP